VVVFPEGTRGEGNVTSAHHGATWIARASGAPLLPVAIRGTRRPAGGGRRFRPRVDMLVGEPFAISAGMSRAELAAATEDIRTRLVALVAELDAIRGAEQAAARPEEAL
ncbi:MAG: lysophospholipid acyltransferase family protein, partial [Pseudonocardiaceae bacterium]